MTILVTGSAGFIGANFVLDWLAACDELVISVDKLAYAGNHGDGRQVRDWLYVKDHCAALRCVLAIGTLGGTYNIGGCNKRANLQVVSTLCEILDTERPRADGISYREQVTFVKDRPGHDRRYAIDATNIQRELSWVPVETFESGISKTVRWYLDNQDWVSAVTSGAYRERASRHYQ